MSLEIYSAYDRKRDEVLFCIEEDVMNELHPIFELLKRESGLEIDLYGTTVLYNNHINILIETLEKKSTGATVSILKGSLLLFLKNSKENEINLVIEGN